MPIYRLPREFYFPPPEDAESSGLLAIGGGLEPQRLVLAYSQGIFPWYSEGQPILWFSPDPRFVLYPDEFRLSRSLKKRIKKREFTVTMDQDFKSPVEKCRGTYAHLREPNTGPLPIHSHPQHTRTDTYRTARSFNIIL